MATRCIEPPSRTAEELFKLYLTQQTIRENRGTTRLIEEQKPEKMTDQCEKMGLVQIKREQDCVEHGELRDSEGQYEKAIAAYDNALKIDPGDAVAWFDKGMTLKKMGRSLESERCIETAINLCCGR
jgi:tetratricopeptide (TPR) repeat protein